MTRKHLPWVRFGVRVRVRIRVEALVIVFHGRRSGQSHRVHLGDDVRIKGVVLEPSGLVDCDYCHVGVEGGSASAEGAIAEAIIVSGDTEAKRGCAHMRSSE